MSQTSAPASGAEDHSTFIKTPRQLITVVLLAFLVPIFGIALVLQMVVGRQHAEPGALSPESVSTRIQPVGKVEVVDASAPQAVRTGEEIVKTTCMACHGAGVAGAPKIGDKAAWSKHVKEGLDGMMKVAIAGKGAMPPRGGLPDLTDYELARAIVFMANQSGGSLKEPPAPAAPAPGASAGAAAPAAAAKPAAKKTK